jgi:hypothetical protein
MVMKGVVKHGKTCPKRFTKSRQFHGTPGNFHMVSCYPQQKEAAGREGIAGLVRSQGSRSRYEEGGVMTDLRSP